MAEPESYNHYSIIAAHRPASCQLSKCSGGLEATAGDMFQLSRAFLMAATSDVQPQPLAIAACQQFGNTLAMSHETCRKIGRLVLPSPEPATIRFLKATVGFYKDDCATQLGSNSAGVRFLGLASALLNSMDFAEVTTAIYRMLQDTASDLTMAPTFTHIEALLKSLEGRCHRCGFGFANTVVGYHDLLFRLLSDSPDVDNAVLDSPVFAALDAEHVVHLTEAFRQLSRIGDSTVLDLTISKPGSQYHGSLLTPNGPNGALADLRE